MNFLLHAEDNYKKRLIHPKTKAKLYSKNSILMTDEMEVVKQSLEKPREEFFDRIKEMKIGSSK